MQFFPLIFVGDDLKFMRDGELCYGNMVQSENDLVEPITFFWFKYEIWLLYGRQNIWLSQAKVLVDFIR